MKDGVLLVDIPESCEKCRFRGSDEVKCDEGVILEGTNTSEERAGRCPIKKFDFDWAMKWAGRFAENIYQPKKVVKTSNRTRKLRRKNEH